MSGARGGWALDVQQSFKLALLAPRQELWLSEVIDMQITRGVCEGVYMCVYFQAG